MSAPTLHATAAAPEASSADRLTRRFAKTEAGRLEIRQRTLPLLRPARNLLLIIDPSRSASEWISVVQGCDRTAFQSLQDAGLVAEIASAGAGSPLGEPVGKPQPPDAPAQSTLSASAAAPLGTGLTQALEQRSYSALYDRITAEALPRLGMIKAYKLIMEVEECSGPAEIRALAQRFIDQVRTLKGEAAGKALAQVLIAPE